MRTNKCVHCGKEFTAKDKRVIYCSKLCKNQTRYEKAKATKSYTKICKQCGKEFTTPNKNVEICSLECRGRYAAIVGEDKRKLHRDTAAALEKRKATWEANGGHPMRRDSIKEKVMQTYKERTGYDHPMHNPESVKLHVQHRKETINEIKGICEICGKEFNKTSASQIYCSIECQSKGVYEGRRDTICIDCGVPIMRGSDRCRSCRGKLDYKNNINGVKDRLNGAAEQHSISKINIQRGDVIKERYNTAVTFEKRIGGQRFDLMIGDNLLIDINPTFTHSSTPRREGEYRYQIRSKDYHLDKAKLGWDNGYRVINVFDWDDKEKILQMINPNKEKINARDCECRIIDQEQGMEFLEKYHLQGATSKNRSNVYYGLFYKGELVEVMSFGQPRYNKNYQYELLRLCTHADYYIIGGASKIFKHFIDEQNPSSVISYCDMAKFDGSVYTTLGFILKKKGVPSRHRYFNQIMPEDKKEIEESIGHKISKPPKNKRHITDNYLRQRGFDQLFGDLYGTYGKGTSNDELMVAHGFLEVYDVGQNTYVRTLQKIKRA